jgi:hypothetical protein
MCKFRGCREPVHNRSRRCDRSRGSVPSTSRRCRSRLCKRTQVCWLPDRNSLPRRSHQLVHHSRCQFRRTHRSLGPLLRRTSTTPLRCTLDDRPGMRPRCFLQGSRGCRQTYSRNPHPRSCHNPRRGGHRNSPRRSACTRDTHRHNRNCCPRNLRATRTRRRTQPRCRNRPHRDLRSTWLLSNHPH